MYVCTTWMSVESTWTLTALGATWEHVRQGRKGNGDVAASLRAKAGAGLQTGWLLRTRKVTAWFGVQALRLAAAPDGQRHTLCRPRNRRQQAAHHSPGGPLQCRERGLFPSSDLSLCFLAYTLRSRRTTSGPYCAPSDCRCAHRGQRPAHGAC